MNCRVKTTVMTLVALAGAALVLIPAAPSRAQVDKIGRSHYQIDLSLDFEGRSFTGSQRLRWVNRSDRSIPTLFFHLYSNLRNDAVVNTAPTAEADQPRLDVTRVTLAGSDTQLPYSMEDQGTALRLNLRDSIAPGGAIEIDLDFNGTVPEIDPDETGLTTHVVKQVSAALRGEKEVRQARDINFRSRGVMLLSTFYPVLAVHDGDEWRRKFEPGVGDMIFNDVADYDVTLRVAQGVAVYTSGSEGESPPDDGTMVFRGSNLRDFAIVAGRGLRSEEIQVGNQKVRSIYIAEHERVGKRALGIAAKAVRVFTSRFGPLPYEVVSVVEAPLVAGLGSHEFSRLNVIASAFYVDFDAPAMRNLPEIIREQRPAVEQSLEWTIAHLIAHQWWGVVVGSDPSREPVLDEGLSSWTALLYYRDIHGDTAASAVLEDELRGVYRLYRTFGGDDMDANRPTRDYRNSFQYEAIVSTKGALMFFELRRLLGEERFFAALQSYYKANSFEVAELEDLRGALIAEAPIDQRRIVARTFTRWLASRRGDEDIARPDQELATSLGLPTKPEPQKGGDRNAFTAFAKVGKFFWQQMTRIR
jgi:peptidase M1-like protein